MAEIIQINENTWQFWDSGVRAFLLLGSERALLIDTGMNMPDARAMAQQLTDLPLELLNTHADRDHTSGNAAFEQFYMNPAEEENFLAQGGKGEIVPVKEGDVLNLGGRPLEIIDLPGHTPGSIAILDVNERVLYSGDTVQDGDIFLFGPARNIPEFMESLKHLGSYADRYDEIYPSHGTLPMKQDLIPKLLDGIGTIVRGEAEGGTEEHLFGFDVIRYRFPYAGFLVENRK